MKAINRKTQEEVEFYTTAEGSVRVATQDGFREYTRASFTSLFKRLTRSVPIQSAAVPKERKVSFYEHALPPLGYKIKASGEIKYPFPNNLEEYVTEIATHFEATIELPDNKLILRKLRDKFHTKYKDQLTNAKISLGYLSDDESIPDYIREGHILWAQDHVLRACIAMVELLAIKKAISQKDIDSSNVLSIKESDVDPFQSKVPVEELAKYDQNIAKKLRTDSAYLAKVLEAKKQREMIERLKVAKFSE